MKTALFVFLLLPALAFSQNPTYYLSADGAVNFSHYIQYTGYGLNVSGNIEIFNNFYVGLNTGFVRVQPFINKIAVPVNGRFTFFTSSNEVRVAPFGLFELGYLYHNDEAIVNNINKSNMKGKLDFFTGVGVKLNSEKKLHSFFAIGYSGYYYTFVQYSTDNTIYASRPYDYRKLSIRAGIMLP